VTSTVFYMPEARPPVRPLEEVVTFAPAKPVDISGLIDHFSVKPTPLPGVSVATLCPTKKRRNRTVKGKKYHTKQPKSAPVSGKDKGTKSKNSKKGQK
jgi:hypothetical protein